MASVVLKNVYKRYINIGGNVNAVTDFNLEINDGEIIVFVGPSGCGKTTTLRMIAGLETISEGEIYIGDKLVNVVEPKDRDIGMIFQNYALFPHMNVFENVAFGLRPHELSDSEVKEKVEEIAKIFDITHLFERMPRELSGGQKQRVALARTVICKHKVILLDEPFSNLDVKLRVFFRTELINLHRTLKNPTFICVTHDQTVAMAIADRIVVMKDGIIQQVGTPEQLYLHPCNLFVAAFLGSPHINVGNGKITENNGDIYVTVDKLKIKLPKSRIDGTKIKEHINKEVWYGIRPEDMHTDEAGIKKFGDSVIDADVKIREFIGNAINLHLENKTIFDYNFTARVPPDCTAKSGDKIKIAFNPETIYIFDKDTEETIIG